MENGAIEYQAFVRGFIAATDHEGRDENAAHPDAYAEGYAEGSRRNGYPVTYLELTGRDADHGSFAGTLELPGTDDPPSLSGTLDWFQDR
ncbi:hypothetical protein [Qaidamihabitans albus]|uniref:hypothetical protein n=1 Tax=Qaidamihabitans albus TaxID=2795733 RepID=UPI0018F1A5B0|nr:hypothetical protein [Qaidamihabitans albus]